MVWCLYKHQGFFGQLKLLKTVHIPFPPVCASDKYLTLNFMLLLWAIHLLFEINLMIELNSIVANKSCPRHLIEGCSVAKHFSSL